MSILRLQCYTGTAIHPYINEVAQLRIEVFREYPYLYDGTMEYETHYLEGYSRSPNSLLVLAWDGDTVVGASTGLPLIEAAAEFQQPLKQRRWDVDRIFYLGESVVRPAYRGRGIGSLFFKERERVARSLHRITHTAFCAVVRPDDDSRRPRGYVPLDSFWRHRGYVCHPELITTFVWKEIDEDQESPKPMRFWLKELNDQRDIADY